MRTKLNESYKRDTSERKTIRKTTMKTLLLLLLCYSGPNIVSYRLLNKFAKHYYALCVSDLDDKITELYLL